MQSPPKDPSSTPQKSPSPPPAGDDFTATEEGGCSDVVARTLQVAVDPSPLGGGGEGGGNISAGGAYLAVAAGVEGGVVAVVGSTPVPEKPGGGGKKRKATQLSHPPPWPPKCNECGKEFSSWKAVFGHMKAHPDRDYRGFFKPPTSSSSSTPSQQQQQRVRPEGNVNAGAVVADSGGEMGGLSAAATGGSVGFDLNQQPMTGEELDVPAAPAEASGSEVNKVGFDLNQVPPPEDDDHQHGHV